jgi:hypothetical protein
MNSIKKLTGCRIRAVDGEAGNVRETCLDDDQWVLRYLVVDTRRWPGGRSVLLSPSVVTSIDWQARSIAMKLTREQVENSPDIDTHEPLSRQLQVEYWPYATHRVLSAMPVVVPPDPRVCAVVEQLGRTDADRAGADAHLKSSNAVRGYHIRASDGSIGHVADFLLDEETWTIRYLITDTRHWFPGKHVLVSPQWIHAVNRGEREFRVALTRRQIEESPEYDAEHLQTRGTFKACTTSMSARAGP